MKSTLQEALAAWQALDETERATVLSDLSVSVAYTGNPPHRIAYDLIRVAAEPEAKDDPFGALHKDTATEVGWAKPVERMMADDDIRPCVHGALPYACGDIECVNCAPEARR